MSKYSHHDNDEEEEEDNDNNSNTNSNSNSNNDCFYDSFDRLLSSTTCSSSAASSSNSDNGDGEEEDDDDDDLNSNSGGVYGYGYDYDLSRSITIPKFPMGVANNYDVWISQPSSVDERRMRLLRQMGLNRDASLTRRKPTLLSSSAGAGGKFGKYGCSDQLLGFNNRQSSSISCKSGIIRLKSDDHEHRNSNSISISNSDSCKQIHSIHSFSPSVSDSIPAIDVSKNVDNFVLAESRNPSGSVSGISNTVSLNKPVKQGEEIGNCENSKKLNNGEVLETRLDCSNRIGDDAVCTIKNLDNGKEFVVDEVREDGMWEKLKEVETGRHLTMEEFEMCVGHSPIVQELMRRQNVESGNDKDSIDTNRDESGSKSKKKTGGWLKSIKNVANSVTGSKERKSSATDERDTSSEKGGRRSSSATDDSQETTFHGPERVRVRQYGKSCKDLTAVYKSQEIQAHNGKIWAIKFSLDGKYLASAGEDCLIHIWKVVSSDRKGDLLFDNKQEDGNLNVILLSNGSPEVTLGSPNFEKKKRGRLSISRKSTSLDHIVVPETMFALSEKPVCSFEGHLDDVLDLCWSKSQDLLSSSMDKTVRLWQLSTKSCLKIFSHSDYVTCIQFNPVDDRYFISGSLDSKVRIWSIPDRQVVDWNDMHEMVTAACYTPDGQAALVGSYKGSCFLYNTTENKLQQKSQINLQNKKKSRHKKITGFQFAPGTTSEVLITSADSRIRVVDGVDLVHKFKGFRNTGRQISASLTANGRYVVCASEDSQVYVWKHHDLTDSRPNPTKSVTVTNSYEHFHCQDVSVAIPWPGLTTTTDPFDPFDHEVSSTTTTANHHHPPTPVDQTSTTTAGGGGLPGFHGIISSASNGYFFDRFSATWPEEKLVPAAGGGGGRRRSRDMSLEFVNGGKSAWGMVIVTAGLRGEIRTFQNFGLPVRL